MTGTDGLLASTGRLDERPKSPKSDLMRARTALANRHVMWFGRVVKGDAVVVTAMANQEVVELLKQAYQDEMETVMNYQTNAIVLDGVRAEEIKESLKADIQEELGHAAELGQRLKQLDEAPPGSAEFEATQHNLQPPEDTTDVLSVIEGVLDAEEGAISTYRSLVNAAREADDPVTEDLAVTLLADEEAHRTEFRGFRKEYKQN
jgi:bacterioferritin